MKKISRFMFHSMVVLTLAGLILYFYLNSLSPQRSGKLSLKYLKKDVTAYYDTWGIPHIEANSENDAFYALGYIHAQDRLFQMELLRRLAKGELASLLGPKLLKMDTFFRTLNIKETAEKIISQMDFTQPQYQVLINYIKGVNSYMEKNKLPLEYKILNIPIEPFSPEDAISISGYMALSFAQAFKIDPLLHHIKSNLGHDYYNDFITNLSYDIKNKQQKVFENPLQNNHLVNNFIPEIPNPLTDLMPGVPYFMGSNAWVVSGALTESGFPILANDPHIGFAAPSIWYEAHIKTPKFELYGHYISGIPVAPIGHTPDKAWGVTMLQNDDIFFYKERVNPRNTNEVMYKGKWTPLKYRQETIKIKGQKSVTVKIAESPHGPIINQIVESYKSIKEPIAMWWAFSNPKNDLVSAFYGLAHTKDFKKIPSYLEKIHAPGFNLLYGDKKGNIAWWTTAKIPKIASTIKTKEFLDGSNDDHEIKGYLAFDEQPQSVNPPAKYIISANSDPSNIMRTQENFPGYYCNDQRYVRIKELLSNNSSKWTIEKMKAIQLDDVDFMKKKFLRALILALQKVNVNKKHEALSNKSKSILLKWSGSHSINEIGPTLYYSFISRIISKLFEDKLTKEMFKSFLSTHHLYNILEILIQKPESIWWHNNDMKKTQSSVLVSAWEETLIDLKNFIGNNPSNWHWSKVHIIEHVHPIGRKKPLNLLFNIGPQAIHGGYEVINNQRFNLSKELPFKIKAGPSTRRLIDLKDTKISLGINPTGQSGYFFDKHYRDQFSLYNEGKYRKQIMDMSLIKKKSTRKLILSPHKI